jgi:hypothetical protein
MAVCGALGALQYLQSQGLIKKVMSYEMEQWQQQQICSDGRFCLCFYAAAAN